MMNRNYEVLGASYVDYKKRVKGKKGITKQAWDTAKRMQQFGQYPADADLMMGKVGMKPGALTGRMREQQSAQQGLIGFLNRLRGR